MASLHSWVEQRHRRGVSATDGDRHGDHGDGELDGEKDSDYNYDQGKAGRATSFVTFVLGQHHPGHSFDQHLQKRLANLESTKTHLCWSCKSRWKKSPHLEEYL